MNWLNMHLKNDWLVQLWEDGTQEISNSRGFFSCLYKWESPDALNLPKYVVRMVVEQREDFKGDY